MIPKKISVRRKPPGGCINLKMTPTRSRKNKPKKNCFLLTRPLNKPLFMWLKKLRMVYLANPCATKTMVRTTIANVKIIIQKLDLLVEVFRFTMESLNSRSAVLSVVSRRL